jgi:hypothetical protein
MVESNSGDGRDVMVLSDFLPANGPCVWRRQNQVLRFALDDKIVVISGALLVLATDYFFFPSSAM